MRITGIQLKNFKRFTDLTIGAIPEKTKLVLLIGANGSGKSSIFDAFDNITKSCVGTLADNSEYYSKNNQEYSIAISFDDGSTLRTDYIDKECAKKIENFIGRSSIRIVPKITDAGDLDTIKYDSDAPATFSDADTRFDNDLLMFIQQIDNALRAPVFSGESADTFKIFTEFIRPLNVSLLNIFGNNLLTTIQLIEFRSPTIQSKAKLIFLKGESKINYDLLSYGEKQVIILLLNFIVRKEQYQDAVIYIDDMDCNINTVLQFRLFNEIISSWIPDTSQLWTASHASGFIEFALQEDDAVILDLGLLNFDESQIILPRPKF
ncbi:MAG TPA: AAA family ATPase [Puia sp.]|jgi:AAA15 family ATPase/GTPase